MESSVVGASVVDCEDDDGGAVVVGTSLLVSVSEVGSETLE